MRIVGIVAEYNPFHNGHLHHIEQTKARGATHIVCVLGGNFTQRGEVSIMSKWAKVRTALACGADLVLELPHPYTIASAPDFAYGALSVLESLGCIDAISFGSECGSVGKLIATANAINSLEGSLREGMADGIGFPAVRQRLLLENGFRNEAEIISKPNNILGVEYLLAMRRLGSRITPITIGRADAAHGDTEVGETNICSATALRSLALKDIDSAAKYMPEIAFKYLKQQAYYGRSPISMANLDVAILSRLRLMSKAQLENIPGVSEGLHNRLYDAIRKASTVEDIVKNTVTKRYSASRIRRIIIAAATGVNKSIFEAGELPYIRVLGQSVKGREILRVARNTSILPKVFKTSDVRELDDPLADDFFRAECNAYDLYSLGFTPCAPCGLEFIENVYSPY